MPRGTAPDVCGCSALLDHIPVAYAYVGLSELPLQSVSRAMSSSNMFERVIMNLAWSPFILISPGHAKQKFVKN